MADGRQFGTILNERRLELGYSLGQFANRIGTTAAQVRAWERGDEMPDDSTVGRIAGELDLPGAALRQSLKESQRPAASRTDSSGSAPKTPRQADRPARREPTPADGKDQRPTKPISDVPTEAVASVPPAPPSGRQSAEPSRAVPLVQRPAASAGPSTGTGVATVNRPAPRVVTDVVSDTPSTGIFAGWDRTLRIVFDPDRHYLVWIRAALTVLVMIVFFIVLSRAVPALFDTISDILDTIESSDTGLNRVGDPIADLPEGVPTTLLDG